MGARVELFQLLLRGEKTGDQTGFFCGEAQISLVGPRGEAGGVGDELGQIFLVPHDFKPAECVGGIEAGNRSCSTAYDAMQVGAKTMSFCQVMASGAVRGVEGRAGMVVQAACRGCIACDGFRFYRGAVGERLGGIP